LCSCIDYADCDPCPRLEHGDLRGAGSSDDSTYTCGHSNLNDYAYVYADSNGGAANSAYDTD
jgi:hypothetical protein